MYVISQRKIKKKKKLLRNFFWTLLVSMRKTTLAPGQLLRSVHMEKSYLGKAGCPVLYNG